MAGRGKARQGVDPLALAGEVFMPPQFTITRRGQAWRGGAGQGMAYLLLNKKSPSTI